jgi:hypothetical protein
MVARVAEFIHNSTHRNGLLNGVMGMGDKNTMKKAKDVFNSYAPHIQKQHQDAWKRVENFMTTLFDKKAKQYEVHHAIEHARKHYMTELSKGFPFDMCEKTVINMYT